MKTPTILFILSLLFLGLACKKDACPNCEMEPQVGPCNAAFVRYYFDQEEGKCKEFSWGGCGTVPFETLEECEECGCKN